MKETPLHKAFEEAMKKIEDDPHQANVAQQLGVMRQVAVDFQEADMPVTLEARLRDKGNVFEETEDEGAMLANGAMTIGDVKLDFYLQSHRYDEDAMVLKMYRDDDVVLSRSFRYDHDAQAWNDETEDEESGNDEDYDYDEDEEEEVDWDRDPDDEEEKPRSKYPDLRSALTDLLINIRAEETFIARFNVGPNTGVGTTVDKTFNVSAPLKLKKLGPG